MQNSVPYKTVSGFAVNAAGKFPILYRTAKVRSAANCWSLPSGLHEIGLLMEEQFANELEEELNLTAIKDKISLTPFGYQIGEYENILPEEGWHWCINVMAVPILDGEFVNKEPDKHNPIEWCDVAGLVAKLPLFHPSLAKFLKHNVEKIKLIVDACQKHAIEHQAELAKQWASKITQLTRLAS